MKYKRKKFAKRILQFLKNAYNFREPFQILIDGTFCQSALKSKINIQQQLKNYLSSDVQIFSTYCVAKEVKQLGSDVGGALFILKQFKQRHCAHFKQCVTAKECILSFIGNNNDHHYFIASQDHELLNSVRLIPGTPIFTISYGSLILQSPSLQTKKQAVSNENEKLKVSNGDIKIISDIKSKIIPPKAKIIINKRRIPKGPNPLSRKKSHKQNYLKSSVGQNQKASLFKNTKKISQFRARKKFKLLSELNYK